jgi:hypothetical protein
LKIVLSLTKGHVSEPVKNCAVVAMSPSPLRIVNDIGGVDTAATV